MISNLYKIKWVENELKYKKEEGSIMVKQQRDKKAKRKNERLEKVQQ